MSRQELLLRQRLARTNPRHLSGDSYSPAPVALPPDLWKSPGGTAQVASPLSPVPSAQDQVIAAIREDVHILVATQVIERGLLAQQFTVTTVPQKIVDGRFLRGYIFMNPTPPIGLTAFGTVFGSSLQLALATGNSQASPIGVASFNTMALFLNISASTGGTVKIDLQSQDPISLNWATTQTDIFALPSAVGTYYANVGSLGIDRAMAAVFTIGAGGNSTFSLGYILKDGLPGGGSGLSNTIFIGGDASVNSQTGFPVTEGQQLKLFCRPNTQLYAVSLIAAGVTLTMFELQ